MVQNGTALKKSEETVEVFEETQETHHDRMNGLSRRQRAALPYLVKAPTVSEGARMAKVARTTLYRWMSDPLFRTRLERLREDAADLARAELDGLMLKSVHVLADVMESDDDGLRYQAARTSINMGSRNYETRELKKRIELIEECIASWISAQRKKI